MTITLAALHDQPQLFENDEIMTNLPSDNPPELGSGIFNFPTSWPQPGISRLKNRKSGSKIPFQPEEIQVHIYHKSRSHIWSSRTEHVGARLPPSYANSAPQTPNYVGGVQGERKAVQVKPFSRHGFVYFHVFIAPFRESRAKNKMGVESFTIRLPCFKTLRKTWR